MFIMSAIGIVSDGKRPSGFSTAVYSVLGHPIPGQNICHYISINLIECWIQEIWLLSPAATIHANLTALANAVYCGAPLPPAVTADITSIAAAATVANLNSLLVHLHNALPNLRIGDASWNHGIGEYFDPGEWVHYNAAGTIDSSINGPGNSGWLGTLAPPPPPLASAFYLCCANDSTRINLVHQINNTTTPLEILSNAGALNTGAPIQFIHSSNNTGLNIPAQTLHPGDPVFYFDAPAGAWQQF